MDFKRNKVSNEIRRKIMVAAGKIFAKRFKNKTAKNWSKALKRAWKWAKETLIEVPAFKVWSPRGDMARVYFDDQSYIQFNRVNGSGYYANHRACKGDYSCATAYFKASGGFAAKKTNDELAVYAELAVGTSNIAASKFA